MKERRQRNWFNKKDTGLNLLIKHLQIQVLRKSITQMILILETLATKEANSKISGKIKINLVETTLISEVQMRNKLNPNHNKNQMI